MAKKKHKPGNKGQRGGKQPGAGKPKTIISPEEMEKAEELAFEGHQNGTICDILDWNHSFIDGRKDIKKKLTKKRAERKVWLRKTQNSTAGGRGRSAVTMQIFLGKNELNQADKQDIKHDVSENLAEFLKGLQ